MRSTAALVALALCAAPAFAQDIPVPARYDGFVVGDAAAPISLEAHFDPLCPDCAAAWPTVKNVMAHYGPSALKFNLHVFPLPYHWASYWASESLHVVNKLRPNATFALVDAWFVHQSDYWNAAVIDKSFRSTISSIGSFVQQYTGVGDVATHIMESDYDRVTRISWKFGCARGVSGTPTFFVNGVRVGADSSWTEQDWYNVRARARARASAAHPTSRSLVARSSSTRCSSRRRPSASTAWSWTAHPPSRAPERARPSASDWSPPLRRARRVSAQLPDQPCGGRDRHCGRPRSRRCYVREQEWEPRSAALNPRRGPRRGPRSPKPGRRVVACETVCRPVRPTLEHHALISLTARTRS